MLKKLIIILSLAVMLILSAGCGEEEILIADTAGSLYTIVRPDIADKGDIDAAVKLRNLMGEHTGTKVNLTTDFEKESVGIVRTENEILIGMTNRDESLVYEEKLEPKDFIVEFASTRIVILGGSGEAVDAAVDYFIENCFNEDGSICMTAGERYEYRHDYPVLDVCGVDIGELAIDAGENYSAHAQLLAERFAHVLNKELPVLVTEYDEEGKLIEPEVSAEHVVRFAIDKNVELGKCRVYVDNGDLVIAAASSYGIEKCVAVLAEHIDSLTADTSIDSAFELTGEYSSLWYEDAELTSGRFIGVTDKDPISYEVGEEMTFTISLYSDKEVVGCPIFAWSIAGDDGKTKKGESDGSLGEITLTASCSKPGYVRVIVEACDEKGKPITGIDKFEGGAGCGYTQITEGEPEPEDFDAFWDGMLEKLDAIEPKVVSDMVTLSGSFEIHEISIDVGAWGPVVGYLTIPVGAEPESLGIKMTFQGYGCTSAGKSTSAGYMTFNVCAHSMPQGQTTEFYTDYRAKNLASYGFKADENAQPETVYFAGMLMRDVQAFRYMQTLGLWNGKDLELSGGSQGGFQAVAMGALLNEYVSKVTASVSWMCDLGGIRDGRMRGWRPDYSNGIRYYDTVYFAKRLKCPIEMLAGLGDYTCPPSGITVLYNNVTSEKKITWWQNRTHSYTPKDAVTTVLSEAAK